MKEINAWLQGEDHDYKTGLQLLKKVERNKYLLRSLSLKENNYTRAKILHQLTKYSKLSPEPATIESVALKKTGYKPEKKLKQIKIVEEEEIDKIVPEPEIDLNNMTPAQTAAAVEKLEIALGKMHNKRGILSNSLRSFNAKDNEGRKKILEQIDSLNENMSQIRAKLDYHNKHGKLPPVPAKKPEKNIFDDIPDDPVGMNKMLLNERSNLSKYKKKLKGNLTDKLRESNEKKLADSTAIVAEIERRLHGI
jgi:hypothetical protein